MIDFSAVAQKIVDTELCDLSEGLRAHMKETLAAKFSEIALLAARGERPGYTLSMVDIVRMAADWMADAAKENIELKAKAAASVVADNAIGPWLSAALDDPSTCNDMKEAIRIWFNKEAAQRT